MRALNNLQGRTREDDPQMARDLGDLIRDMRRLNPTSPVNDPLLEQRIQAAVLSGIEQVEMQLRRKVEDNGSSTAVRSEGGANVPPGFAEAVAEYFRRLSKGAK